MTLNFEQVKQHWEKWAKEFGTSLRATTKTPTIKMLEIFAFTRHIMPGSRVLDVGCGNGYNAISFAEQIKDISVIGVDYSSEMIQNANHNLQDISQKTESISAKLRFQVADALDLPFKSEFDVVTTDRCIINLTTLELQKKAIAGIAAALKPGGAYLMLENCQQTFAIQNDARIAANLPARLPSEFNLFIDEETILPYCQQFFEIQGIEDFGSLHDLILYVLLPALNNGADAYEHPFTMKAVEITMDVVTKHGYVLGKFGQNRLYLLRKK